VTLNRDTVIDCQAVADRVDGSEAPKRTRTATWYVLLAAMIVGIELALFALALLVQSGAGAAT